MPLMTTIVPINPGSDGNQSKWPDSSSNLKPTDDEAYRAKLATKWMTERGDAQPGMTYVLNRLPVGYRLYGKSREGSSHIDRYLCGHPKYKFRSTEEFYDHFVYLMDNASNSAGCDCKGCTGRGTKRPRTSAAAQATPKATLKSTPSVKLGATSTPSVKPGSLLKPLIKPAVSLKPAVATERMTAEPFILPVQAPRSRPAEPETEMVDEEGTEDIWRQLVDELREHGTVDKPIAEPDSIDWCLEYLSLERHLQDMQSKPRWMPRVGELVLFVRNLAEITQIHFNDASKTFSLRDQQLRIFNEDDTPWEAGVVVQMPEDDTITLGNLVSGQDDKEIQVSYSGFRVEAMPEVGNQQKPWSKWSAYVPLHHLRPFNFWRELTKGIPAHKRHPTINHAMTAMSSFSLLHKFHFKGRWPDATIFSKGIYIGPELILTGDIVRLLPTSDAGDVITDVLHVTAIKMKMINLEGDLTTGLGEEDEHPPRWNTCIHLSGYGYTTDATRAIGMGKLPLARNELPRGLDGYGSWYRLHGSSQRLEVPFVRVFSRCFEDAAINAWFPRPARPTSSFATVNKSNSKPKPADLSLGLEGTTEARALSSATDPRIARADGKTWWWGDSRVDQLDLHSVHAHDVGAHSRYGDDEKEGTLPRQTVHLEAMKKAKRSREKGLRGSHGFKGEKSVSGLTKRFAASGMAAGGLNAVASEGEETDRGRKRGLDAMNDDGGMDGVLRMSQIDQADFSGDELDDDELVANQLVDELTGDTMMADAGSPAKRARVIELD